MLPIYSYAPDTHVFTESGWAAPDQLTPGNFMIPAFATAKRLPEVPAGKRAVFDVETDKWGLEAIPDEPLPTDDGPSTPVEPSFEQRLKALQVRAQMLLDVQAQSMGYDDMRTAVTYADEDADPVFQAEGRALRAWRSRFWRACYLVLDEVKGGAQEPTWVELLDLLPVFPGVPVDVPGTPSDGNGAPEPDGPVAGEAA